MKGHINKLKEKNTGLIEEKEKIIEIYEEQKRNLIHEHELEKQNLMEEHTKRLT